MKSLNELFEVTYGNKFDFNKMRLAGREDASVANFVGRSSENHGVTGRVQRVVGVEPYEAGLITVALGGSKLLASFVQVTPFYTAQNVAVLRPREPMAFAERLYYCLAIRHNRYRYTAFGREANRTLRTLVVPEAHELPGWLARRVAEDAKAARNPAPKRRSPPPLRTERWRSFVLSELFDIAKGKRLTKANMRPGRTPFISALDSNNGLRQRIDAAPLHPANVITVNYNGNGVADAYFQSEPFLASDDVNVLYPKVVLDPAAALFICTVIRREKYRFSYGRKWGLERMKASSIRLPIDEHGGPDWVFMRSFVESLAYGDDLAATVAGNEATAK